MQMRQIQEIAGCRGGTHGGRNGVMCGSMAGSGIW
jgi:hypothetical protein